MTAVHAQQGRTILASPGEPLYIEATASYNLAVTIDPQSAATVTSVEEIQDVLAVARSRGVGVRVIATGHGSEADAPYTDEILIRTRLAGEVVVDPVAATATIPAGTAWADVAAATAPHGLVPLHGSSGTVSAVGYLLGGGVSFYGRKYGLASNLVTAIELVLADGTLVTVDADNDPDLFFALRGGGGGTGIVTSVTTSLIRVDSVATGITFWPGKDAAYLLDAWETWTKTAPAAISTSFRVMNLPPLPGVPPQLVGGPTVAIDGVALDDAGVPGMDIANGLLAPLRAYSEPLLDTWHVGPPADALHTHMDPPDPVPSSADHFLLDPLGAEGQRALLAEVGQPGGDALLMIELRQLGGALAEADPRGGAVSKLDAAHLLYALGVVTGPDARDRIGSQLADLRQRLAPWNTGYIAPTFAGGYGEANRSFPDDVAAQVADTRKRVDPDGLFRSNIR